MEGSQEEDMKRKPEASYDRQHIKDLKDPTEALHYLNAAVYVAFKEDEPELILLALYHVARAQGVYKTAKSAKMHRVSLHRMLNKGGNPEWRSLFRVLSALHFMPKFEKSFRLAA